MESFMDRKERKKGEENNFYLILTNTKKWKASPNKYLAWVAVRSDLELPAQN